MDTNIDNYSNEELLEIIGLDGITDKKVIENKINDIISRLHKRDNNNFLEFFKNVKDRFLNENKEEEDPEQAEIWLENQFLPPTNENVKNRLTNRSNQFQVLDSPHIPIMHRKNLGIQNSIPLEVAQDSLNPNLRQKETRIIMIDSKDRPNIVPFSTDPNHITSPTNFTCNLSINLTNVISMRVSSVCIPSTFTIIDEYKGNNFFDICGTRVTIPNGNYTLDGLIDILNYSLSRNHFDISFEKINSNNESDPNGDRLQIINNGNNNYDISFFDKLSDSSNCSQNNIFYTTCLAYYLGFRYHIPEKFLQENINCNIKIPDIWAIRLYNKNSDHSKYSALTVPDIVGPRFFNLCVDDFQNNQSSSSYVNIKHLDNRLSLPNYINRLNKDEQRDPSLNCFINTTTGQQFKQFVPRFPRKLTQNQLYSANSILLNQNKGNNRQQTLNNQHVLATINIPPDILHNSTNTSIILNNISKDSTHIRNYFGPVNIQRLKISLYDNYGFLVNLNNHDWNFTLHVEQLYQY